MLSRAAVPALLCLFALASSCAQAALPFNILPRAEFIEDIARFPDQVDPPGRLYEAESDSYADSHSSGDHSVTVSARAENLSFINGSPLLSLSGRAVNTGPTEIGYEGVAAVVEANYYFEIQSAGGDRTVPIILPIEWSANVARENEGFATVRWEVSVTPQLDRFRGLATTSRTYIASESFHNFEAGESNTTLLKLNAYTSEYEYYKVHIKLTGAAGRLTDPFFYPDPSAGAATFSAFIDPLPYVDPAFANAGSISFAYSENLFAVPEPSQGILMVLGAVPLVWAISRARRRPRA